MLFKVLVPLYHDGEALLTLFENIDHQVSDIDHIISIVVVNDGSNENAPDNFPNYSKINSIKIINLKKNVGHARSIATGLKFILENDDFDYIIPMDSDGEDRPDEIKELIKKIEPQSVLPIVCERVKRSEGIFFKFCYFLHKLIVNVLKGITKIFFLLSFKSLKSESLIISTLSSIVKISLRPNTNPPCPASTTASIGPRICSHQGCEH